MPGLAGAIPPVKRPPKSLAVCREGVGRGMGGRGLLVLDDVSRFFQQRRRCCLLVLLLSIQQEQVGNLFSPAFVW
jgi:hypothetical protein